MLFQLRAHNPAESITSNPSSQTSTNSSSSAEHHPHQPQQLFSYAGPLSTPTPPSAAGSAQAIKSSSSSESLNNSIPPPSSAASSSSQSIFNSASSLADTSIGMLPDFLNSQQAAIPGLSPPATRKDDTAADHIPNNHHHHSTSHRQAEPPLLVSTLNLPPSCSSSAASSSSALDHSPGSINGNPILGSKPATSAASPASIWPTPTTAAHLPAEFNDPFRLFHLPQQPQQAQQQQQPFIQTHQQQQPSGSSSSSSPSSHSNLIPPLAQPQPRSQPGQMLLDPSTEFVFGTQPSDLSTHDFLPSPPSPSALLAQHHFHPLNHHPLYQHPYNRHNSISSPIDHPSFVQAVQIQPYPHHPHQPHPHNPWNAPVDIVHPTTFYDPFQIKHRRRTTPAQLGILEAQFQANCKPDVALRKQLADRLDMTPREVQVWFQNRRAKTKKLEKRAEQESSKSVESEPNGNSSRPEASPPGSIYLSPPSMRALVLPAGLNDNPDQPRIGVSHPSLTSTAHANGESEEVEEGLQYRFDTNTDRRHRSHSLHHHPYYLPPSNLFSGQAGNALTPLAIGNGTLSQQHQQQFSDPSADDQSLICRRSSNTSIASSTATATDSNLIRTPTTTEFSTEDNGTGLPDGFDPRRRSSCPAEFIQSFGHFGLANGQLTDVTNAQIGLDASFTPTTSQTGEHLPSKLSLAPNPSAPFTILEDQNGGWEAQAECWKTETSREGIQRRHSLATIGSPLGVQDFHSNRPIPTDSLTPSQNGLSSLFPWGPVGYPAKHLSSFDSHNSPAIVPTTNVSNGCMSQGYGRRASTSVLKSIEEHPGNMWN